DRVRTLPVDRVVGPRVRAEEQEVERTGDVYARVAVAALHPLTRIEQVRVVHRAVVPVVQHENGDDGTGGEKHEYRAERDQQLGPQRTAYPPPGCLLG